MANYRRNLGRYQQSHQMMLATIMAKPSRLPSIEHENIYAYYLPEEDSMHR
jgi:hypothetical protein